MTFGGPRTKPNNIDLGPKQIANIMLDLLEEVTGYKRASIRVMLCRRKMKASNIHDVHRYIAEYVLTNPTKHLQQNEE